MRFSTLERQLSALCSTSARQVPSASSSRRPFITTPRRYEEKPDSETSGKGLSEYIQDSTAESSTDSASTTPPGLFVPFKEPAEPDPGTPYVDLSAYGKAARKLEDPGHPEVIGPESFGALASIAASAHPLPSWMQSSAPRDAPPDNARQREPREASRMSSRSGRKGDVPLRYEPSNLDKAFVSPEDITTSPRARNIKGVHDRTRRALGRTEHEAGTFNELLDGIFAELDRHGAKRREGFNPGETGGRSAPGLSSSGPLGLRSYKRPVIATMDDALLDQIDQLKEEMSQCATDLDVMEWAKTKFFSDLESEGEIMFPRWYPYMLANVLKTLRLNYNNPHLALAVFNFASTHSIDSYLSGCQATAYNEVLSIRWDHFRDLEGVGTAVREMDRNAVQWNRETRELLDKVVSEVSSKLLTANPDDRMSRYTDPPSAEDEQAEDIGTMEKGTRRWMRYLEGRIREDLDREHRISSKRREWSMWNRESPDSKASVSASDI